ncbi:MULTISPECIES: pyridoxamine 5'-phosphate oxidase family protein [unclassified Streptomyces]|uniref:pyridoxamine 5'-phosphate oxidase family protein n=1 Tax=unclassified Streptomyces TaxID=2593676 RepID=UPI002252C643|nr:MULTISPECIES: pyridoxamine 5'-phosphate oxidase family protein [unclassified Streptomyces]MCX4525887.1 pyridoxamine 5'-phosphate oxidase family protein [Streptomyces sp. NBC_01551]MCX4543551.1 pyridoxamine 5'-phosphate oxidase family protein [Streptomyces sp. NBC_01565]
MAYHWGSLAVQDRLGVRELADHVGRSIGPDIPLAAAAFLARQPHLVVGAADGAGRLWASLLTAAPGFVRATAPDRIAVAGGLPDGDPLAGALATAGTRVGTISLDPRTRRRLRLNGTLDEAAPGGFAVAAGRVFGNCPKYLQKRQPLALAAQGAGVVRRGDALVPDQERAVRAADTFFVATAAEDGVEASHRGGLPGFVEVHAPGELSWPDYAGNAMFLTLGNLTADPRAGLLFPDWESGAVLQLSGRARPEFGAGGERRVRFFVDAVVEGLHPGRLLWSAPEYSPANPPVVPSSPPHLGSTTR